MPNVYRNVETGEITIKASPLEAEAIASALAFVQEAAIGGSLKLPARPKRMRAGLILSELVRIRAHTAT